MKLIFPALKFKRFLLKSCRRWSIFAALFLYAVFITLVKYLEIPLKSDDGHKSTHFIGGRGDNIVEYLHRMHNLKTNQGFDDYDKVKIQPFYTLEEIFHKADYNHDNSLSVEELAKWINTKTQEHIHEAIFENYKMFMAIDIKPKNGLISWEEYHSFFLQKNGFNKTYIMDHNEKHPEMSRNMKEAIMRDKAAWSECARLDPDHLTLDEFLSFRHPESSYSSIISLVDEIYRKFGEYFYPDLIHITNVLDHPFKPEIIPLLNGQNYKSQNKYKFKLTTEYDGRKLRGSYRDGDDILTEDEFSTFQSEDTFEKSVHQEEKERRQEFREMVDLNKDGKATRREMMTYIDPKNPRHAKEEAETLFDLADIDRDGRLTLVEIFNKMDLFLGSKMVDTGRSFHDEF